MGKASFCFPLNGIFKHKNYFLQNLVLNLACLWEKQNENSMHKIIHCKTLQMGKKETLSL